MQNAIGPVDLVNRVRDLQGAASQVEFSRRLGIDQSELSRFLRRERGLTVKIASALLRTFPEMRDDVIAALTCLDANAPSATPAKVA